jgi:hypothetical protein
MKAGIYTFESLFHCGRVGNISVYELGFSREILAISAREVIEYSHRVALVQQRFYQMRAYEPGPASHEYASHPQSSKQLRKRRFARRRLPHGESPKTMRISSISPLV